MRANTASEITQAWHDAQGSIHEQPKAAVRRELVLIPEPEATHWGILEELERREAQAAEEARTGAASVARLASYESMADYLELLETYLLRRAELEAAEAAIQNLQIDTRFRRAKIGGRSHSVDESDLDSDLLHAIPDPSEHRGKRGVRFPPTFTAGRARKLREFAEVRAEEERSGNGVDRSQPYGTWDRQMNERRKTERARRAEKLPAAEERSVAELDGGSATTKRRREGATPTAPRLRGPRRDRDSRRVR